MARNCLEEMGFITHVIIIGNGVYNTRQLFYDLFICFSHLRTCS